MKLKDFDWLPPLKPELNKHPTGIMQDLGEDFLLVQWGNKYIAFDTVKTNKDLDMLMNVAKQKLRRQK